MKNKIFDLPGLLHFARQANSVWNKFSVPPQPPYKYVMQVSVLISYVQRGKKPRQAFEPGLTGGKEQALTSSLFPPLLVGSKVDQMQYLL